MKKSLISLSLVTFQMASLILPGSVFAERSGEIKGWEDLTAPKGYILSNDLYYERNCSLIWEKQVPEFQKKNPHVEDPDVIPEGTKIIVQRCHDQVAKKEEKSKKEEAKPELVKNDEGSAVDYAIDGPYLHFYGGFLSEKMDQEADPMLGVGITGDVFPFLGYNLRINGASSVLTMHNELRFKTSPAPTRGHFIIGLGNRIGLKNKDMDRLTKGVDSFTYTGFGVEFNRKNYRLMIDVTGNVGSKFTPNLGVTAQKRLGDDYWLGLYADWFSTRSLVDDDEDRRCLTGGIKFSF